jgi:hypothetical protein
MGSGSAMNRPDAALIPGVGIGVFLISHSAYRIGPRGTMRLIDR